MAPTTYSPGQRVTATLWGIRKVGTVENVGLNIVWVRWDGDKGMRWVHKESLALADEQGG